MKTHLFSIFLLSILYSCSPVEPIETLELITEDVVFRANQKKVQETIVFYPHKGVFQNRYLTAEFLPHEKKIIITTRETLTLDLWAIETVTQDCGNAIGAYVCNEIYSIDVNDEFISCFVNGREEGISMTFLRLL